jgi:hypothetical protein
MFRQFLDIFPGQINFCFITEPACSKDLHVAHLVDLSCLQWKIMENPKKWHRQADAPPRMIPVIGPGAGIP